MSTAHSTSNKTAFRRFHETTNTHDQELISKTIDEMFDAHVLLHVPSPAQPVGLLAVKAVFARLHEAFPDLRVTVEDLVEEGDKVVGRNSVTGTHRGEYLGLSPTLRTITYDEIIIFRFVDGRIAGTWGVVDVLSQMKQLGIVQA
jgi:predicted ester cyclase